MTEEAKKIIQILEKRPDLLAPTLLLARELAKAADVPVEEHLLFLQS